MTTVLIFISICILTQLECDHLSLLECSSPCLNGGRCSYNSTCQCPPGWTGPSCGQSLAPTFAPTSLHQINTATSTTYSTSMLNSNMSPASILEHINKINSMPTPSYDFSFIPTLPPHPSSTTEELIYPATLAPTPPPHPSSTTEELIYPATLAPTHSTHQSSTTEELIYPATSPAPTLVSETCQPSCLNRGTCSFVNNIRSCQCPPNYSGPQCEHEEG